MVLQSFSNYNYSIITCCSWSQLLLRYLVQKGQFAHGIHIDQTFLTIWLFWRRVLFLINDVVLHVSGHYLNFLRNDFRIEITPIINEIPVFIKYWVCIGNNGNEAAKHLLSKSMLFCNVDSVLIQTKYWNSYDHMSLLFLLAVSWPILLYLGCIFVISCPILNSDELFSQNRGVYILLLLHQ